MTPRPFTLLSASLILSLASASGVRADATKHPAGPVPAPAAEAAINGGPKTSAGGRIVVEKPTVDAGDVVRGTMATAVFEILNRGTGVLKIITAKPG